MEANPRPLSSSRALFILALLIAPALLLWHLHLLWNPGGDYAYGWVVPLLAAFLLKFRWDDRPLPSAPLRLAAISALLFALVTLPARWLQEAAPERSICAWCYGIAAVGISLSLVSLIGGATWLRWFSFPFAFVLTAIPWPHPLEFLISNFLMRGTAAVTVEILCLIGIPASQAGNLVHIEPGVIDIDEACSGIRSLQAMVMISLFLGELFRLKPARRARLILLGLAFTLLANLLRTVALSGIGFAHGMSAVDRAHDAAGLALLILSLSATLLTACLLRPAKPLTPVPTKPAFPLPVRLSLALLAWCLFSEISVEAWYRFHEPKWHGWSWSVQWPREIQSFHFIQIPDRSLRLLMCDESHAAAWKEPGGADWSLYWVRWNPGNPQAEAAKVHRPDVCLNAEGAIMERDMGTQFASIGPLRMPFHGYTFRLGEKVLYVFFSLYQENEEGEEGTADPTLAMPQFESVNMLRRALAGRRDIAEQSLELSLSGYPSETAAQAAFNARLGQLILIAAPQARTIRD